MIGSNNLGSVASAPSPLARVLSRRRARSAARGVTLVEVLIVVAIMAVIAGGATLLVFPEFKKAKINNAVIGAGTIKTAAELYMNLDATGDECPTVQDLVSSKKIDSQKTDDPFGKPYRISCEEGDIHVYSDGSDRKENTPDDIREDFKPSDVKRVAEL